MLRGPCVPICCHILSYGYTHIYEYALVLFHIIQCGINHHQRTGADEVSAEACAEVVEDSVTMRLSHLGVNVVAAVAEFRDLLGQKLHPLSRVAEDNALIDLQLSK